MGTIRFTARSVFRQLSEIRTRKSQTELGQNIRAIWMDHVQINRTNFCPKYEWSKVLILDVRYSSIHCRFTKKQTKKLCMWKVCHFIHINIHENKTFGVFYIESLLHLIICVWVKCSKVKPSTLKVKCDLDQCATMQKLQLWFLNFNKFWLTVDVQKPDVQNPNSGLV